MYNLCEAPSEVFLPTQSKLDKKRRILHPYQNLTVKKNGKAYRLFENQKDIHRNKALFFGGSCPKDFSYLLRVFLEECCASVQNKARTCNCLLFLRANPYAVDKVA